MAQNYLEVVLEGHYELIFGLLEGFKLGSGKEGIYYFNKKVGVKTETLSEVIKEWVSFANKMHHIIIEEGFYNDLMSKIKGAKEQKQIHVKYVKSSKLIKGGSFDFSFKTFGKKYGDEIKEMFKSLPVGIELMDFKEEEKVDKDAKGVEMYAPAHDYELKGSGKIKGDIKAVIDFRHKLDLHPLVEPQDIKLSF